MEGPHSISTGAQVVFPAGVTIIREGAPTTVLHLIVSGIVTLSLLNRGSQTLVSLRTTGSLLGAVPAILGQRHQTTAIALTDTVVRRIATAEFHGMRREDSQAAEWIATRLAREVLEERARSEALTLKQARPYVEYIFTELFRAAGVAHRNGSVRLGISMTVTDLATLAGISRQWLTALLSKYEAAGILVRERGWYVLPSGSPLVARVRRLRNEVAEEECRFGAPGALAVPSDNPVEIPVTAELTDKRRPGV